MPATHSPPTDAGRPVAAPRRTGILGRLVRGMATLTITTLVIAGAGAAVWQGSALLAERAEASEPSAGAAPLPVSVRPLVLSDGFTLQRDFIGELTPRQSAELSFELAGRLTQIDVDEGDRVRAGDVIARLDTAVLDTDRRRTEAARAALAADLTFAERRLVRQQELKTRGFSPEESLDNAEAQVASLSARLDEIDAQLAAIDVRLDQSLLRAPFDGQVAARLADTGETVRAGSPVLRLLEGGRAELRVGLPLWVKAVPGDTWPIDVSGTPHEATLTALRPDIDPVTRTRTALFDVAGDIAPFGTIATVEAAQWIATPGAWVPRTALREGAPGVWTLLVVDAEQVVRAATVEVLHAEVDRVYVAGGIDPTLALVTGGPHRIVPGQRVTPLTTPRTSPRADG